MGDIFAGGAEDANFLIDAALYVQNSTGIQISATFNNTMVRPDQKNLETWIENFRSLYERGVRSCKIGRAHV